MKVFQIRTKKDWCIAGVFAALAAYGVSTFFSSDFQGILLRYGNPMLTDMNQPKSYGNVIFTILIMVILLEAVWWKMKRRARMKVLGAAAGTALAAAVLAGYFLHCDRIVSSIESGDGTVIDISPWGKEADIHFTDSQEKEIDGGHRRDFKAGFCRGAEAACQGISGCRRGCPGFGRIDLDYLSKKVWTYV